MDLSKETVRFVKRMSQRSRALLHGMLARDSRTKEKYLLALERIDSLTSLRGAERVWNLEAHLGDLVQQSFSWGNSRQAPADLLLPLLPEACDSLLFTELTEHLIENERCTLTNLGRFDVRQGRSGVSIEFVSFPGIEGKRQDPPSTSDVEIQVAINGWHEALEKFPRMPEADSLPGEYEALFIFYAYTLLPRALANVLEYRNRREVAGHTLFGLQATCIAYASYSACITSIATMLHDNGQFEVPVIGTFLSQDDRVRFQGHPDFITLLSTNLPLPA